MTKKVLISGLIISNIFAAEYTYNIYLNFNIKNSNNINNRYNKIINDVFNIVKKNNEKNKIKNCKFNLDGTNIKISCYELSKKTIPYINKYVSNNVINEEELFSYKIIRKDKEIGEIIKNNTGKVVDKIKLFFKKEF